MANIDRSDRKGREYSLTKATKIKSSASNQSRRVPKSGLMDTDTTSGQRVSRKLV